MSTKCRLLSFSAVAVTMLVGGSALAQLPSADQKCIDGYNNKLRLVSAQAGKDYRSCIKNAGKGTEPNPDGCILADTPAKIAGKVAKVNDLYTLLKCTGAEVIQQGAVNGSNAHIAGVQALAHDIFGDPVSGVVSPGKTEAKCQDKLIQRSTQALTEIVKGHRKCKKDGMKAGSVVDSATLDANCGTFAQMDPGGKALAKLTKLNADVGAACTGLTPATIAPGACAGSVDAAALGACVAVRTKCRTCEILNNADGENINCDAFDDGLANGSCGIVMHKCVLDTSPTSDSQIQIHIAALPVPLIFGMSGALDIGGAGGIAACNVQSLAPINIPAIGFVCISPASGCAAGARWCGPGPGPALGISLASDGNAGACTSNAACQTIANGACGGAANVQTAQCTGQCSGTTPQVCTSDAQCLPSNGACNGPEPVAPAQANICQISCQNLAAGGPSDPGDMQCNLGSNLNVETGAPCDGTDTLIAVGSTCIPVSTERATATITDANFTPGSVVPPVPNVNDQLGNPVACATVDGSTVTGLAGVGAVNFFGSALGDLSVGLKATCN